MQNFYILKQNIRRRIFSVLTITDIMYNPLIMVKEMNLLPICVDLDGTLIFEDVTVYSVKKFLCGNPLNIFSAIFWIFRGTAYLKKQIAMRVDADVSRFTYNRKLLEFIKEKKAAGHRIFLATASDGIYANKVADFLEIFDGVFASDGKINLRAESKADTLVMLFGEKGFAYVGNSVQDVPVWMKSAESILVNPSKAALKMMKGREYYLLPNEEKNG